MCGVAGGDRAHGGDGSLPSGKAIAGQYGRQERWGRLVKQAGLEGAFATDEQAA